jgi:pyruvate-ferredoxin/flavodoxin oxidoreductase
MDERAPRYPGIRVTANGNQLVSYHTETRVADAGVFYPITPSTEGGELFQQAYAEGRLNAFGRNTIAIEAEGEHAAQGGAIAYSVCGRRVVNFTSGQGLVYARAVLPRAWQVLDDGRRGRRAGADETRAQRALWA